MIPTLSFSEKLQQVRENCEQQPCEIVSSLEIVHIFENGSSF